MILTERVATAIYARVCPCTRSEMVADEMADIAGSERTRTERLYSSSIVHRLQVALMTIRIVPSFTVTTAQSSGGTREQVII